MKNKDEFNHNPFSIPFKKTRIIKRLSKMTPIHKCASQNSRERSDMFKFNLSECPAHYICLLIHLHSNNIHNAG